ncbi:MAG TPA: enoyl-CoA hydratase [Sphingopyxis sp.]|nr:enoyl-CoA hydratase [Sphingopyxis sp.]
MAELIGHSGHENSRYAIKNGKLTVFENLEIDKIPVVVNYKFSSKMILKSKHYEIWIAIEALGVSGMSEEKLVNVTTNEFGVRRITMNRASVGNAQNVALTYALNEAMMAAAHDPKVKVIILSGAGKHFSTGHDLRDNSHDAVGRDYPLTSVFSDVQTTDVEGWFGWEREVYLDMCRRWRSIPKPTIAEVRGACIGGGLMLAWVCDIIIAAEDAFFQDPVVNIGVLGVEYFAHPWELGARKAKELLFTADRWSANDAREFGMVNHVIPADQISEFVDQMADKIASKPIFAIKLAKSAVNGALDAQGQRQSIDLAFAYHQINHADNRLRFGGLLDPSGIPASVRTKEKLSELVVGDGRADNNKTPD